MRRLDQNHEPPDARALRAVVYRCLLFMATLCLAMVCLLMYVGVPFRQPAAIFVALTGMFFVVQCYGRLK